MTPQQAIGMLDRQLAKHGSDVVLVRGDVRATVRAFPRGYKGDELGDGISQGDSQVVLSPSSLVGTVFADELPQQDDWVNFGGRERHVENGEPVLLANVVVRINLQVRG